MLIRNTSVLYTWLDHIDVVGIRAKEPVRQLLSFSRPNEEQPKRINLETGVHKAIALSQSSLPSSIEIDYRPGSELPDVQLDIGELQHLITDQTIPEMLGTELAGQAKNRLGDLKVILCNGHSEQVNADYATEQGIDRFLEKPIVVQDIVIARDELSK